MNFKKISLLCVFLFAFSLNLEAENKRNYRYSKAYFAFDFASEKAILLENFNNHHNRDLVADKIYSIDFEKQTIEQITSSKKKLSPFAVSPDQNFILFNQSSDRRAVLYDVVNKEIVVTRQGNVRLIYWNNLTGRFYLKINEPKGSAYEYDFEKKQFVDAPLFKFVTTRDSKGPYRLDFFGNDMDSIWSVIQKDTGQEITEFYETNGNSKQNPLWSSDFQSFWFYPHSKLINIDKRITRDFSQDNRWLDISHNQKQVFVYDQDDEVFYVVDAFTGEIQKSYQPFWRKTSLKAP